MTNMLGIYLNKGDIVRIKPQKRDEKKWKEGVINDFLMVIPALTKYLAMVLLIGDIDRIQISHVSQVLTNKPMCHIDLTV